jgi:glycosyltransferase involved in cell wall biosynthesis
MNPTISVLMPVYNAERYVAQAVESILDQTFRDFEFLIVDDGSTDGSLEILKRFAAQDDRIRLISRPNTGYVVALNQMLALARGEFIARMDADDISAPNRFQIQLDYLNSHNEILVLGSAMRWIDPDGDLLRDHTPPSDHESIDQAHLKRLEAVICHPTTMIRRIAFEKVGYYNPDFFGAEDLDLWLRIAEIGILENLPDVLLSYRFHPQKVGIQHRGKQLNAADTAIRDACKRRGIEPEIDTPVRGELSTLEQHRTWAWWALNSGNMSTARKYAIRLLAKDPTNLGLWKLFFRAIRGY